MVNATRAQRAFDTYKASQLVAQNPSARLFIVVGDTTEKAYTGNQRMAAFAHWLSGSNAPENDMVVVIHSTGIDYVQKLVTDTKVEELPNKNGSLRRFNKVADCLAASAAGDFVAVPREPAFQKTEFAQSAIQAAGASLKEDALAAACVSDILCVKDQGGVDMTKKASALASALIKKFITGELEQIAANPESRTLESLSAAINTKLAKPNTIPGLEQMTATFFGAGYIDPPRIFAGDAARKTPNMTLKDGSATAFLVLPPNPVDATFVNSPSVAMLFGAKHAGFTSCIGRTFFLREKPSSETKKAYKFLQALEQAIVKRLGAADTTFGEVYQKSIQDVSSSVSPDLVKALPSDLGGVIGLHNHDTRFGINNAKGAATKVQQGMIIAVRLILLPQDAKAAGVDIGDTPLVIANSYHIPVGGGAPKSLTKDAPSVDESIIEAAAAEEDDDEAVSEDAAPVKPVIQTRAQKGLAPDLSAEQNRLEALKNILKKKHEEWIARGKPRGGADAGQSDEFRIFELGRLGKGDTVSYPSYDVAPSQFTNARNDIHLDRNKMSLWLPLNGPSAPLTPIHVSAISKAEMRSAGQQEHYFTVTFHSTQEGNLAFRANRTKVFVRETTFCGPDSGKFYQIANAIKELQQTIKTKDAERKSKVGVVAQGGLKTSSGPDRLPQVKCRPPPATGKAGGRGAGAAAGCEGNLDAHDNGFRFTYNGGFLDILYDNVKFMICQPSKNDILVIFHLSLRNAIMVGNKKTDHIQFIAEVMEGTMAVTSTRMSHEEEMAREENDAMRIKKTNIQFAQYAKKVSERSGLPVEQPFSNVNFEGSATRGTVNFRGNSRCLWSIIEQPFFVMGMENVEVVALERVMSSNINFDMAFVNKDYRTVQNVTTVPMSDLEKVKDWLLRTETIYFEASINISWNPTLRQIRDDPDWIPFSSSAGWATMMDDFMGSDGDEDGEDEEGDDDDDDDDDEDSDETYEDEEDDDDSDDDWSGDSSFSDDSDDEDFDDSDDEDFDDSDDSSDDGRRKKKHKSEKSKKSRR